MTQVQASELEKMRLDQIADVVVRDWERVSPYARPYVEAMRALTIPAGDERVAFYGADSAVSVIAYFLNNATTWRGDTARAVKAELRRRLER